MISHDYGDNFNHKTVFKNVVVFSDTEAQRTFLKPQVASPNVYIQITPSSDNPDLWLVKFNNKINGEYGDSAIQKPNSYVGSITQARFIGDGALEFFNTYAADFSDGPIDYYLIDSKYYIQLDGAITLDEVVVTGKARKDLKQPTEKTYFTNAQITILTSSDGAKLEHAYLNITQVHNNEIVLFCENNKGNNLFGSVVRVKTGSAIADTKAIDQLSIAKLLKNYSCDIGSTYLKEIINDAISDNNSLFVMLRYVPELGSRLLKFTGDFVFGNLADAASSISKEIDDNLKLSDKRWNRNIKGYDALIGLDALKDDDAIAETATKLYNTHIAPFTGHIEQLTTQLKTNSVVQQLLGNKLDVLVQLVQQIPQFLKQTLKQLLDTIGTTLEFLNALLVGILNSLVDLLKSIFDLMWLIFKAVQLTLDQASKIISAPSAYVSLLIEGLENGLDLVLNALTLNNLKAVLNFIIFIGQKGYQLVGNIINAILNPSSVSNNLPTASQIGYYSGYLIGWIVQEAVFFIVTGGASTLAGGIKAALKSYAQLAKSIGGATAKVTNAIAKGATLTLGGIFKAIQFLIKEIKQLPKHLDNLKVWFDELLESFRATPLFKKYKAVLQLLDDLGVVIAKSIDDAILPQRQLATTNGTIFNVNRNGETIYQGTQKAMEKFFDKINDISKSGGNSKKKTKEYLDELAEANRLKKLGKLSKKAVKLLDNAVDEALIKWKIVEKRPGAASVIEGVVNGKTLRIVKYSAKGIHKDTLKKLRHPLVNDWLDNIANLNLRKRGTHGKCAEPLAISEFLFEAEKILGINKGKITLKQAQDILKSSISKAKSINNNNLPKGKLSHGLHKSACNSCNPLLNYFNIIEDFN